MNRLPQTMILSLIGLLAVGGFVAPESGYFDAVRLKYFNVVEDGGSFVLTWESAEEESVLAYELERKTTFSNNEFLLVKELSARGRDIRYQHRDDQIFKASGDVVDYRLVAVYASGAREILVSKSVNYTPTALRRTWGSIKAMF